MTSLTRSLTELDPGKFEQLCYHIVKEKHPGVEIRKVEGSGGDAGLDTFGGKFSNGLYVWQCKYFVNGIKASQKKKIEKSLRKALDEFELKGWVLCVPVPLTTEAHRWFQNFQRRYGEKVDIGLFDGPDIEHELLYRDRIRQQFFPGLDMTPSDLKALLSTTGEFTTDELEKVTTENVAQLKRRLEAKDARFTYRITFPHESTFPKLEDLIRAPVPPGLLGTFLDEQKRVDVFVRDPESVRMDPPKFEFKIKAELFEKFQDMTRTGSTQEFEIADFQSSFDFLFPDKPTKVVIGPAGGLGAKPVMLGFRLYRGTDSVLYNLLKFSTTRAGTEEAELVTCDSDLPFQLSLVVRFKARTLSLHWKECWGGKEIKAVQKANKIYRLLESGCTVELCDSRSAQVIFRTEAPATKLQKPREHFEAFVNNLVTVSETFGKLIRLKPMLCEDDLRKLSILLKIIRNGKIALDVESIEFRLSKEHCLVSNLTGLSDSEAPFVFRYSNYEISIMETTIDAGPYTLLCRKALLENLKQTKQDYINAEEGGSVYAKVHCFVPVELEFDRFPLPTTASK